MSSREPKNGMPFALPGITVMAPAARPTPPQIQVPYSAVLADYLMPNPSIPVLYVEIHRDGEVDRLSVEPESLEWVLSVDGADMLKFTVPDPEYLLIDHPMLQEDFRTEVRFRYGYNNLMSEIVVMRFFRQRPEFPAGGAVKTTIVCYDLSVFLNFEVPGKTLEGAKAVTVKDVILANIKEANDTFGLNLKVVFDNCEFENSYYRVTRPHGPLIEHIAYIRKTAKVKGAGDQTLCEVYVDNETFHFHPPRRQYNPIGAFAYFAEHPGSRLLSFETQVDLAFTSKHTRAAGVNTDAGSVESVAANGSANRAVTSMERIDGASGVHGTVILNTTKAGDSSSQVEEKRTEMKYTATGDEGNNLMGILEKFPGANYQEFLDANGFDPENKAVELKPKQVLTVPVPTEGVVVSTPESETMTTVEQLEQESRALNASAVVLGNPRLSAGLPADFYNVGRKWSGRWYIREVTHTFGSEGYRVNMSLTREGFTLGSGLDLTTEATPNVEPTKAAMDAAKQKEDQVKINAADGNVLEGESR